MKSVNSYALCALHKIRDELIIFKIIKSIEMIEFGRVISLSVFICKTDLRMHFLFRKLSRHQEHKFDRI